MNTLILALENNEIKIFLTNKDFESSDNDQLNEFCKSKDIKSKIVDLQFYKNSTPEQLYLSNLKVVDGKITLDEEKFIEEIFQSEDSQIIQKLLECNYENIKVAEQRKDKFALGLFEKNTKYLKNLTVKDFYTKQGKVNRFCNIGGLIIKNSGKGYTKDIQATISNPPRQKNAQLAHMFGEIGKTAKISCTQKDGKLANIFVEDGGCGYFEPPTITFSEPDDPDGEKPEVEIFPLNYITFDDTGN